MTTNRFAWVLPAVCPLLLVSGCNNVSEHNTIDVGTVSTAPPSDFKPVKAVFVAPKPRQPAKMTISFVRNLSSSARIGELRFNFWSTDAVGTPVYYGSLMIDCRTGTLRACSAKQFDVDIGAGRLCRTADASVPGQTFPCALAPSSASQMHVVTEWKDAVTGNPNMQVDRLTPTA